MSQKLLSITTDQAIAIMKGKGLTGLENANVRYHEFYDIQPYNAAGFIALPFFGRNPAGLGIEDTNLLTGAPQLPASQAFVACAISMQFTPGADRTLLGAPLTAVAAIDDFIAVTESGRVNFKTGTAKEYVSNGPLRRFPAATQLAIDCAASDTSTAAAGQRTVIQLPKIQGPIYEITPKVLKPLEVFTFESRWNAQVPVSIAGKIEARMYGFLADFG